MKKKILSLLILVLTVATLACGVAFSASAEEAEAPTVSIDKFNLVFEDNVYLKYAVKFSGVDESEITASNIGMLYFTAPKDDYTKGGEAYSSAVVGYQTIDGEKYYTFEYRHITAKQMTDYIYSVAYIDLDGERIFSAPVKYSVLDYCYSKLGKTGVASTNADFRDLLTATLQQGAAAQKYFGYNTGRLASAEYYLVEVVGGTLEDGFTKGLYHSGETATLTALDKSQLICASWQTTQGESYDISDTLTITEFSANERYEIVNYSNHTEIIDEATASTCTETGLTEGKHCSVCNEVLIAQTVVNALGHTEVIDEAVEPTCIATGLTEGKHCSVCGEILISQEIISASHTEIIDEAVAPTCTTTGLTEGKHCSTCGTVLIAQQVIEAKHNDTNTVCSVCGYNTREFAGGNGTEVSPYLISTAIHLSNVRLHPSAHYELINDIKFTSNDFYGAFYNSGSYWDPIDDFTGSLDGNNYAIDGLKMNRSFAGETIDGVTRTFEHFGLFSSVEGSIS